MSIKQIKKDIKDATTGLTQRGYKGGYMASSDAGWNEEVSNLKELRELLLEELKTDSSQKIGIAIAFYDKDKYNHDTEQYGAYNFDEGWVSSVGGYQADRETGRADGENQAVATKEKEAEHQEVKTVNNIGMDELLKMLKNAFIAVNQELNEIGFDSGYSDANLKGLLDMCLTLKVNHRLRSSAGKIRYNTSNDRKFRNHKGRKVIWIELHPELPNDGELLDTMRHEALHFLSNESDNQQFKYYCRLLDISPHHSLKFSTMEAYKYKTICKGCGRTTKRYKRKANACKYPDRYISHCCGENLRVEEL